MDPAVFTSIEVLLDQMAEIANQQLGRPEIHRVLAQLTNILGKRYTVSLNLTVDVCDSEHERSLPLLSTGVSATVGKEPYRTWGDSTPQRYVLDEGIQVVPHDRCPKCWEVWDFKLQNPTCSHCGATLGEGCKLLLDTDECPWCQEGQVTVAKPRCDQCGFEVDPRLVVWG
jgi:ribosomal protein L37E